MGCTKKKRTTALCPGARGRPGRPLEDLRTPHRRKKHISGYATEKTSPRPRGPRSKLASHGLATPLWHIGPCALDKVSWTTPRKRCVSGYSKAQTRGSTEAVVLKEKGNPDLRKGITFRGSGHYIEHVELRRQRLIASSNGCAVRATALFPATAHRPNIVNGRTRC